MIIIIFIVSKNRLIIYIFIFIGYIRFLNDRRDQFRSENPNLPFAEITKVLATEWNQLPADKKQVITFSYIIIN